MFESERKELVEKLKERKITDNLVLDAFLRVERHLFLPKALESHAYRDVALPIGFGQTISQPFTVAFMTQELKLQKGAKVLEIGTGSGYQAAILVEMGMKVFSIERQFDIYARTRALFDEKGIHALLKFGDGTIGWEEFAPYDGIIVTAGSPSIPNSLKKQLVVGSNLVIPVGDRSSQILTVITKVEENIFNQKEIPSFTFVPLIGREGWES
ncbi:MAG: protein-L-isoaspartate(D-aspartate) O-methyltransferase [Ignavibacteriaceae bacterium]|jgi:protein-L-isoaspartate(D-aspartate) O-methyltransferase|nr:protein-L-isoaspartate(D-aspartate) O-methyltransferase [Ignavibacteriaceae bacterium]